MAVRHRNSDITNLDPKFSFCYSCLNDDESVQCYSTKGPLQKLMGFKIPLCCYCKEVAKNAQKFITNIRYNQTWIKRPFITAELIKERKIQHQENLHQFAPNVSESGTQTVKELLENEWKPVCDSDKAKVKQEEIDDDDFNNQCIEEDFDSEQLKKEENTDGDNSLMKLKTALRLQGVEVKIARTVNNEKPKAKKRKKRTCFTTKNNKKKVIQDQQTAVSVSINDDDRNVTTKKKKKVIQDQQTAVSVSINDDDGNVTTKKKKKVIQDQQTAVSVSINDNYDDGNSDDDENARNTAGKSRKCPGIEIMRLTIEQMKEAIQEKAQGVKYTNAVFKCTNCVTGFRFREQFDKHMEKHDMKSGLYMCEFCTQRFQSHDKLQRHISRHSSRYRCKVCGKTDIRYGEIRDHYEMVHNTTTSVVNDLTSYNPYKCQLCTKSYKGRRSLYVHMRYVHKKPEYVECQHCQKIFKRKETLQRHLLVKHPDTYQNSYLDLDNKNVCEQCGKSFHSPSALKNHLLKHQPTKQFYCVECDRHFKYQSTLDAHLKTTLMHIGSNLLRYACGDCGKRFKDKRVLSRHINIEHLNIKPYKCDQCTTAFSDPWYLKKHIKLVHSGYVHPRIFQCPMCDKKFKLKGVLQGHIRTHTGERPYSCSECSATFCQSSSLGTHFKLIHLRLNRDGKPKDSNSRNVKK